MIYSLKEEAAQAAFFFCNKMRLSFVQRKKEVLTMKKLFCLLLCFVVLTGCHPMDEGEKDIYKVPADVYICKMEIILYI